jgi:hypothetical protein
MTPSELILIRKNNDLTSAITFVYPALMALADLLSNPDVVIVDPAPAGIAWILQQAADTLENAMKEKPENDEEVTQ